MSAQTTNQSHDVTREISRSRARVISYLMKLNKCVAANHADLAHAVAQRFNELLIDYVSYGHFRFLNACQPEAHQLVAIERITQQAVLFSEKYTETDALPLADLKADLEKLAYALETRFEIEDEIVSAETA